MIQQLDNNCGEFFSVWKNYVYFQSGNGGLYRVKREGGSKATQLDPNCRNLVVADDDYVYFQAGNKGLYKVPCTGKVNATQLHKVCGDHLAVWKNHVYFQGDNDALYRIGRDGKDAKQLFASSGRLVVPGDNNVYFKADGGLYRIECDGRNPTQLHRSTSVGYLVVHGNFVYFQTNDGLYRIGRDGTQLLKLHDRAGHIAVPGDGNVYFRGADGLYSVPSGGGQAKKLDPNCTRLVAPGDGWVYFQAGSKGLYRVPCNGLAPAKQLDPNCGALIASGGYIYFQGGPNTNMLYRFGAAPPYLPAGFRARVQDEYVVETVLDGPIGEKRTAIANLLDEAHKDSSDTWFVNFTSGTSTGAYPDAVAGRINDSVKSGVVSRLLLKKNRLGTIVMDFPDNNGNTSTINTIFAYNKDAAPEATDWMRNIPDSTKLSQLTIPGTHDTCSSNATKMSKCQNLTLPEQLNAGVRFVDIRCRHYQDKLFLHHGSEYLGMDFNYALKACRDFLKAHPTECIIMSVKEEHVPAENEKSFDEVFTDYVSPFLNLLHYDSNIPKLGDVRGKVVLFRRFFVRPENNTTQWGIDMTAWVSDTTFSWPYGS